MQILRPGGDSFQNDIFAIMVARGPAKSWSVDAKKHRRSDTGVAVPDARRYTEKLVS
jgi:hypothetical protein